MAVYSLEHRIAAVARSLAIRLNEPQPAALDRMARSSELAPLTRRRVELLHDFRLALSAGATPDTLELELIETVVAALEDLLGVMPPPAATTALERASA